MGSLPLKPRTPERIGIRRSNALVHVRTYWPMRNMFPTHGSNNGILKPRVLSCASAGNYCLFGLQNSFSWAKHTLCQGAYPPLHVDAVPISYSKSLALCRRRREDSQLSCASKACIHHFFPLVNLISPLVRVGLIRLQL